MNMASSSYQKEKNYNVDQSKKGQEVKKEYKEHKFKLDFTNKKQE